MEERRSAWSTNEECKATCRKVDARTNVTSDRARDIRGYIGFSALSLFLRALWSISSDIGSVSTDFRRQSTSVSLYLIYRTNIPEIRAPFPVEMEFPARKNNAVTKQTTSFDILPREGSSRRSEMYNLVTGVSRVFLPSLRLKSLHSTAATFTTPRNRPIKIPERFQVRAILSKREYAPFCTVLFTLTELNS